MGHGADGNRPDDAIVRRYDKRYHVREARRKRGIMRELDALSHQVDDYWYIPNERLAKLAAFIFVDYLESEILIASITE